MRVAWVVLLAGCGRAAQPVNAQADANANANTQADANANAQADADANAEADANASADVRALRLRCLARHFGARVDGDGLVLPDGRRLAWDDGRKKSFEEALDAPDLEDMLRPQYPSSAIAPVVTPDFDPGRARVQALFEATYGATGKEVRAALVPFVLRGATLTVHRRALSAFQRVAKAIDYVVASNQDYARFFEDMGGTFNDRVIAGTARKSAHAYGIAIDLNPARAHYWRSDPKAGWKNTVPASIVAAFEKEGFAWGGRWYHYDTMHFEWRPELFDPECGYVPSASE